MALPVAVLVIGMAAAASPAGAERARDASAISLPLSLAQGLPSAFPPLHRSGTSANFAGEKQGLAEVADERGTTDDSPGPSRRKTILLSALVPGLGQLMHGDTTTGSLFLAGEVASWTSLIVFNVQGSQREDRYIEYAERFAGVEDASGQSDAYYGHLATYDRSGEPGGPDSYNEVEVRQYARDELYPGDRAAQEEYIRQHSITGAQAWDWESDARRQDYNDIRIASETAYHRAQYAVAGLVIGRVLSVMHAIWLTNDEVEDGDETDGTDKEGTYHLILPGFLSDENRLGVSYRF
jgi:hypothetical protein